MVKLANADIQLLASFEQTTGATAFDVLIESEKIVFLVKKEQLGRAIGRQGANIERLKRVMGKRVEVIPFSDEVQEFLKSFFKPVEITSAETRENAEGKKVIYLKVDQANKGLAIGRGGEKINRARVILKRHFDYADLKIL
ncbi:MAG: NusA-like transcription termination signal-binding factor [Candidatus Micrarchaeota archaeon]